MGRKRVKERVTKKIMIKIRLGKISRLCMLKEMVGNGF